MERYTRFSPRTTASDHANVADVVVREACARPCGYSITLVNHHAHAVSGRGGTRVPFNLISEMQQAVYGIRLAPGVQGIQVDVQMGRRHHPMVRN